MVACQAGVRCVAAAAPFCVRSHLTRLSRTGLVAVIVKSEDDLRQEQLAMQLIKCAANIFEYVLPPLSDVFLRPVVLNHALGYTQPQTEALASVPSSV